MASWFVRPETDRLEIGDGKWIIVKRRLSSGEQRAAFARMYVTGTDGQTRVNPLQTGIGMVAAYLIDWNLTDDDGMPVTVRGLSTAELESVLDSLTTEGFGQIRAAIEKHEARQVAARDAEKKTPSGAAASSPTSPSPSDATGPSTPSAPLIPMSAGSSLKN